MLPGFCTCPVDLLVSFKGIARTLGMAINECPDLRLTVCHALRTIINKSCTTGRNTCVHEGYTPLWIKSFQSCVVSAFMSSEEEKAELGRFSKNFLPIFFNVYSQQPPAGESGTYRMAILDTVKVYLSVTQTEVSVQQFCFTQHIFDKLCFLWYFFLSITNGSDLPQMVCTFLQKAIERLGSTETTEFTR